MVDGCHTPNSSYTEIHICDCGILWGHPSIHRDLSPETSSLHLEGLNHSFSPFLCLIWLLKKVSLFGTIGPLSFAKKTGKPHSSEMQSSSDRLWEQQAIDHFQQFTFGVHGGQTYRLPRVVPQHATITSPSRGGTPYLPKEQD